MTKLTSSEVRSVRNAKFNSISDVDECLVAALDDDESTVASLIYSTADRKEENYPDEAGDADDADKDEAGKKRSWWLRLMEKKQGGKKREEYVRF